MTPPATKKVRTTSIDCTGDVVTGDVITFQEAVWGGSRRKPKIQGHRTITAKVVKDSYGKAKQQHTFTLLVISSNGYQPLTAGEKVLRKGRNVYRNGCTRLPWADESTRESVLDEKHDRGDKARRDREWRRALESEY